MAVVAGQCFQQAGPDLEGGGRGREQQQRGEELEDRVQGAGGGVVGQVQDGWAFLPKMRNSG